MVTLNIALNGLHQVVVVDADVHVIRNRVVLVADVTLQLFQVDPAAMNSWHRKNARPKAVLTTIHKPSNGPVHNQSAAVGVFRMQGDQPMFMEVNFGLTIVKHIPKEVRSMAPKRKSNVGKVPAKKVRSMAPKRKSDVGKAPADEESVVQDSLESEKEERSMGLIQDSDAGKVLANQEFMEQVVSGLVEDSSTMDALADDIAGNIQDAFESDSDLRHRLISAAMSNEVFKQKLVEKIIQELDD